MCLGNKDDLELCVWDTDDLEICVGDRDDLETFIWNMDDIEICYRDIKDIKHLGSNDGCAHLASWFPCCETDNSSAGATPCLTFRLLSFNLSFPKTFSIYLFQNFLNLSFFKF